MGSPPPGAVLGVRLERSGQVAQRRVEAGRLVEGVRRAVPQRLQRVQRLAVLPAATCALPSQAGLWIMVTVEWFQVPCHHLRSAMSTLRCRLLHFMPHSCSVQCRQLLHGTADRAFLMLGKMSQTQQLDNEFGSEKHKARLDKHSRMLLRRTGRLCSC